MHQTCKQCLTTLNMESHMILRTMFGKDDYLPTSTFSFYRVSTITFTVSKSIKTLHYRKCEYKHKLPPPEFVMIIHKMIVLIVLVIGAFCTFYTLHVIHRLHVCGCPGLWISLKCSARLGLVTSHSISKL